MIRQTVYKLLLVLVFFKNFSSIVDKEEKYSNAESTENFRKVQLQTYCKKAKASLKPFGSEK